MVPYGSKRYYMVPYVALPKLSAPPLYAAYTQPIRSYTPDLYAQSIRQIHLYAAYTSGYTPGPIRQNTVLRGVGRPAPFRIGHQKCCPTSAKKAVIQ